MLVGCRRNASALVLLFASIAAGGSATGCSAPARTLPSDAIELDVVPVRQQDSHACGLATVEALAAYHGLRLDDATRRQIAARTAQQEGLTGADLRGVLEAAGLEVFLFRGTLDHTPTGLWRALDEGLPPIVAIASAPGSNHYLLLVGYDPHSGDVAVLDPAQGRLVIPAERFATCWEGAERFTLLAVPTHPSTTSTSTSTFASRLPPESQP